MCTDDITMHAKAKSIEVERVLELKQIGLRREVTCCLISTSARTFANGSEQLRLHIDRNREDFLDGGEEHSDADGFTNISVHSAPRQRSLNPTIAVSGHGDNRNMLPATDFPLADFCRGFQAAHFWHFNVHKDEVERFAGPALPKPLCPFQQARPCALSSLRV